MHEVIIKTYECFLVYQYKLQLVHINLEHERQIEYRKQQTKNYFKAKRYVLI